MVPFGEDIPFIEVNWGSCNFQQLINPSLSINNHHHLPKHTHTHKASEFQLSSTVPHDL